MTRSIRWRAVTAGLLATVMVLALSGCGVLREFRGANSFPLPGAKGGGAGAYTVQVQMPDVQTLKVNSRVRVNDVNVGGVTKIERQGWHALVSVRLDRGVDLPENATATLGQTSLLGSVHIELAPPKDIPAKGKLKEGSLIPLSSAGAYPNTEQTLTALSLVLNGGGIDQVQHITQALGTAFTGREQDLKSLIKQLDHFVGYLDDQKNDIIAAADSLNNVAGQLADQKPVLDKAFKTLPQALTVLKDERENLADALGELSQFGALLTDSVDKIKTNLTKELKDLGPVLQSLADAGPALTRSLDFFLTFPFPRPTLSKWLRGDSGNLTAVIDLTLSRIDNSLLTGTFLEGILSQLELQQGRTIGQIPSPYTARNPLTVPYHFNQGP
jgi:phospholipid/cholesterol/gamma-HCH transport system substrate-binding protein